ncbi:MAG TPA: AarF/UbiB family protein [Pyrinomonadaceae bacterium]|jgi:ubiquinone biosynthesis protein
MILWDQKTGRILLVPRNSFETRSLPVTRPSQQQWRNANLASRARPKLAPRARPDIPARHVGGATTGHTYEAALRSRAVKVSRRRVFWRFLRIVGYGAYFYLGVLQNRVRIKNARERMRVDAVRFRKLLEYLGGVLIKVGQQMSQRPDLLPPEYCDELENLLHEIPTKIDDDYVVAAIERQAGRPMKEIFSEFDFEPVGSASVSCVYNATLLNGHKVAVKIRRPRIQEQFTADLTAVDWVLTWAEILTLWRPGMTNNLKHELRDLLLEELDFRREARHQELFREYHKQRKKLNVTAPKIYYKYSGEEVMVSEFVTGRKVKDIIAALDVNDEEYLAALAADGIDPKRIAKQLARSRYYSFHECPLFHGDPHPGNIIVQPNNRIVMIDFGACGVFSERDRNLMWQMNYYYSRDDVGGMVNMVLSIMEPIPPVPGINQFRKELLDAWWTGFYGIKSKHAAWWERTSFRLWLRYFELIRKYQIPIPRNMVRMIRATLLYDTVAARLYGKINVFREFEKYSEGVAARARKRILRSMIRQLLRGPDDSTYLRMQQIQNVGNGILYRVQKWLDDPDFSLSRLAGKVYYAFIMLMKFLFAGGIMTLIAVAILWQFHPSKTEIISRPADMWDQLHVLPDPAQQASMVTWISVVFWLASLAVFIFIYGRRVLWRFRDVDD